MVDDGAKMKSSQIIGSHWQRHQMTDECGMPVKRASMPAGTMITLVY